MTYDEVNDLLPPEIVSSDQIDDLMMMFGEMDIEVVDAAHKLKVPKQREEIERLPGGRGAGSGCRGPGKIHRPRVYVSPRDGLGLPPHPGRGSGDRQTHRSRGKGSNQCGSRFPFDDQGNHPVRRAPGFEERSKPRKLRRTWTKKNIFSRKSSTSSGSWPWSSRSRSSTRKTGRRRKS